MSSPRFSASRNRSSSGERSTSQMARTFVLKSLIKTPFKSVPRHTLHGAGGEMRGWRRSIRGLRAERSPFRVRVHRSARATKNSRRTARNAPLVVLTFRFVAAVPVAAAAETSVSTRNSWPRPRLRNTLGQAGFAHLCSTDCLLPAQSLTWDRLGGLPGCTPAAAGPRQASSPSDGGGLGLTRCSRPRLPK